MLSNQYKTSNMQTRQRQQQPHRRQNSTQMIFEAPSSSIAPAHRRGMTVPFAGTNGLPLQERNMVGMTTNPGQTAQHYMQVAHSAAQARPGQPQPLHMAPPVSATISAEEYRRLQHRLLDEQLDLDEQQQQQILNHAALAMERSRSNPEHYIGMSLAALQGSPGHDNHRPGSSRSEGPHDFRSSLHAHGCVPLQRPLTPPSQNNKCYTPMTPTATPRQPRLDQFEIDSTPAANADVLLHGAGSEEADSAVLHVQVARRGSHSNGDYFQEQHINGILPSPPRTATVKQGRTFDVVTMPTISLQNMPKLNLQPTSREAVLIVSDGQSHALVQAASPSHTQSTTVDDFANLSPSVYNYGSQYGSPERGPMSPNAMLVDELGLEATIEDTGVSSEEVQSYIAEPTETEAKWTCLYPDCGKKFGRKENIRSHVQTHLGDRQFKCIHCNKCFVRQHDLKRHSKIHSGVKPYMCRCGADFARHDALTRHRTRGVCIGAFEGVVKKHAKRGRPKKDNRPDDEERYNKAARTQNRVAARAAAASYDAASVSGTDYNSSWPGSPEEEVLRASVELELQAAIGVDRAATPQPLAMQDMHQQPQQQQQPVMALAPSAFSVTPPQSPSSTACYSSPQKTPVTQRGAPSPAASQPDFDMHVVSGAHQAFQPQSKHAASETESPPELSHSSPPSSTQMMEFDFSASTNTLSALASGSSSFDSKDFDMFDANATSSGELFGEEWANDSAFFSFDKASTNLNVDELNELSMFS